VHGVNNVIFFFFLSFSCFYTLFRVFRRVRKIAKSDRWLRHVCPSVRPSAWNNSAATRRIFMKYLSVLRKSVEKIQVSLKSDSNKGYLT
jgi:hypothetical protein